MAFENNIDADEFDPRFKIFHELMANKIREVLLVSTPYDAWIMDEDCRLSERIIHEYRGLNLSHPPRFRWVSSAEQALESLDRRRFDMVITMPRLADMDACHLGQEIKRKVPQLPVVLLAHSALPSQEFFPDSLRPPGIDRIFVWSGNTDILVSLMKSAEDQLNVEADTRSAGIRVILFVEDSPAYISSLLPLLYREVVSQTQAVMEEGLNEEHRLLTMRARPKILVAEDYETALQTYQRYEPYVLGVFSDMRFPRRGLLDDNAGVRLLSRIAKEHWDIPLLLASSDPANARRAAGVPAVFVDKNSPTLHAEVRRFFTEHLGFGDFVFRAPDGREVNRAASLRQLAEVLPEIPDESLVWHCNRNDFSRWLFARTEIVLAQRLRPFTTADFAHDLAKTRRHIVTNITARRRRRQQGVVVNFDAAKFDPETEFFKIGKGSLGGKARGLAFVASLLRRRRDLHDRFPGVNLMVPPTLVLTTDAFEAFVDRNDLRGLARADLPDARIAETFSRAEFPDWVIGDLRAYLTRIRYPLAVRSSSLLEDAQFRAYAGLYRTYMVPNNHPDVDMRLANLLDAVRMVYASTYFLGPKAFSRRVGQRTEEERMAVIIQQLVGNRYDDHFYPAVSGVAQSHNYYPFGRMRPEEGIATIAMGLGRSVVEGERTLRFSPKYPQLQPQNASVEDVLDNAQRWFYSLRMDGACRVPGIDEDDCLHKQEVIEAEAEGPFGLLASTYMPEEHRIRDTNHARGHRVLTFAPILKYETFPLAPVLSEVLALGQEGMGCPVEMEFSVDLSPDAERRSDFAFLQLRPMTARAELMKVDITAAEIRRAICFSTAALGNAHHRELTDILFIKPEVFDPIQSRRIAQQVGQLNGLQMQQERKYLLVGPGRWGSNDPWLGIPVKWTDICGVGAIVETAAEAIKAEPSQGSHFFHNITTLGINYITIAPGGRDFFDWQWLASQPVADQTEFVARVKLPRPLTLKVDGRVSHGVLLYENEPPDRVSKGEAL